MTHIVRLRVPRASKAHLMEIFAFLPYEHEGITFANESNAHELFMDAATVGLVVSSGTLILIQLLKSLTNIYLDALKKYKRGSTLNLDIKVVLATGEVLRTTVASAEKLEDSLPRLPHKIDEVDMIEVSHHVER